MKVSNQRADTNRARALKPVATLGFHIRGMVSDAEDALCDAQVHAPPVTPLTRRSDVVPGQVGHELLSIQDLTG